MLLVVFISADADFFSMRVLYHTSIFQEEHNASRARSKHAAVVYCPTVHYSISFLAAAFFCGGFTVVQQYKNHILETLSIN